MAVFTSTAEEARKVADSKVKESGNQWLQKAIAEANRQADAGIYEATINIPSKFADEVCTALNKTHKFTCLYKSTQPSTQRKVLMYFGPAKKPSGDKRTKAQWLADNRNGAMRIFSS